MSKNAQVLVIEPANELVFKGPFTDVVTCHLSLRNPTDRRLCFKVKTTAPKQYCVRPNSGFINPGETSSVAVMLQPFDSSTNASSDAERAKHKFMVQSVYAPPGDVSLDTIWKTVAQSELMDSKLRVVFEPPSVADSPPRSDISSPMFSTTESKVSQASDLETEVQTAIEERKKAEANKAIIERENASLKARLAALESVAQASPTGSVPADNGIALLQVALIALAALLVGLIFGKLF